MSLFAKTSRVHRLMTCILSLGHGLQPTESTEGINTREKAFQTTSASIHTIRKLTHITFQGPLPEGCAVLDFTHDFESVPAVLVDVIQCTDFCGPGKYVNLTLTSVCTTLDVEGCVNTVDCIVPGCNDDCDAEAGECDCTDKFLLDADGNLAVDEGLCDELCAAEQADMVTLAPTVAPTYSPVSVVVPTLSPTSAPVEDVAPTDSPVAVDSPTMSDIDCFSNTTLLAEAITTLDTAMHTTFKLCPNTLIRISDIALDEDYCSDDNYMAPLFLRSNVTIQCGDDGSSSNNCTLQGGKTQVTSLPDTFGQNTINASVYGVTFKAATEMGALLANAGDVSFIDCVFKDHVNFGAVSMVWSPAPEAEGLTPEDLEPGSYWNQVLEVIENVRDFTDQFRFRRSICKRKLSTQKMKNSSSSSRENRELTHITFQGPLPEGCAVLDFTHDFESVPAVLVDVIQCTDFCGPEKYVNLTLTSVCTTLDVEGCVNTVDCIVPGCNDDCDAEAGECDCTDKFLLDADGNLAVDEGLCDELCAAEQADMVTLAPTVAPTSSPVSVVVPTLSPTSAPVEDVAPTDSPVAVDSPTASPNSLPSEGGRQKIVFRNCTFFSNQPLWSDNSPKAVVAAETAFNDLLIEDCYFSNNDFGLADGVGAAVLIQTGSTIHISGTCFVSNDFKGPGTVVVVGSDQDTILFEEGLNNFGTEDDGLTCEFIALVASLSESPFSCVDYDAEQCSLVSPADPTVAPTALRSPIPSTPGPSTAMPIVQSPETPTISPSTASPIVQTPTTPTISPSTVAPIAQSPVVPSTSAPSTAAPTLQPVLPTTEAPPGSPLCTICPAGTEMTLPDATIEIPAGIISDDVVFATCELVDRALASDPDLAEFCDLIQQNYAEQCGCIPIGEDSGGEDSPAPASPATEAPASPATAAPPESPLCTVCPAGTEMTLPGASVAIPAGIISDDVFFATCELVDRALASDPDLAEFCDLIQQNYAEQCGCIPIGEDSGGEDSPAPASPTTEVPASPTTEAPPGSPLCTVCPAGTEMTLPGASVAIPAGIISDEIFFATCELVDRALASNPDLAEYCDLIQQNYAEQCGCIPIGEDNGGEDSPTPASPTTEAPPGSPLCTICPAGTEMSLPQASVAIPAGIISDGVLFATCELVDRALASNPDLAEFCDLIQQNYAEQCGCIPISDEGDGEDSPPTNEEVASFESSHWELLTHILIAGTITLAFLLY